MQQHGTHGIGSTFGARICARRSSCASRFAASVRGAASAPAQPTWITSSRIAVIGNCLLAATICRAYATPVTVAKRPQKSRKLRSKNDCSLPPSYVRARALAPVCTGTPSQTRARKVDHLPLPLGKKVLPRAENTAASLGCEKKSPIGSFGRQEAFRAAKGKHHFGRRGSFRTPGTAAGKGASNGSTC